MSMWWTYPMKPVRIGESALGPLGMDGYLLEKKYDGHRAILIAECGKKVLLTRQKRAISLPPGLRERLDSAGIPDGTVLDGEIWNPMKRGGWTSEGGEPSVLTFWDCLMKEGVEISGRPIEERRAALEKILEGGDEAIRVIEQESATGARVAEIRAEATLARKESQSRSGFVHGVVLKRRGSPRRDHATRSREHSDWMKVVFWP